MKAIKVLPLVFGLILLTYVGVLFVEANRDPVTVRFGQHEGGPTALGFVILTSALVGMIFSAFLAAVEVGMLIIQNRSLRKKLRSYELLNQDQGNGHVRELAPPPSESLEP